jgi:simple sugar transport system permease protein
MPIPKMLGGMPFAGSIPVKEIGFKRPQKTGIAALLTRPEAGAVLATICVFAFFAIFADKFLTERVISNVFLLSAELGIVAVGVTMLMISGEFDLSVGSVFGLAGGIVILALNGGVPGPLAVLLVIILASAIGALNGFLVTRLRIHSLIITLGALMLYRAVLLGITGGFPLRLNEPSGFLSIFSFWLGQVPGTFFWLIGFVIVFTFILTNTKLGNWVFATGGAREAAREMGVPTHRVKIMMFMVAATLAAIAGTIQMARFSSIDALRGDGLELEAVLAVVVGGASLNGGYGSIVGAALGVIMLAMIKQGLILMDINAYWYRAGIGVVLVVAAILNQYVRERAGQ